MDYSGPYTGSGYPVPSMSDPAYRGPSVAAPPVGRVTDAEQATRRLLESLQEAIAALEQSIAPVLRSASPSGNGSETSAQREPSPFASSLIANNQKLRALVNYVRDLATRVDF
jgi:hypothetical protein